MKQFFRSLKSSFNKSTYWNKLVLGLASLLIIVMVANAYIPVKEGFIQKEKFILKEGPSIYDDFYASLYDELLFSNVKNDYEIGQIINKTSPTDESIVLDIGSGTGHHVNGLTEKGIKAVGLDKSDAMVLIAKENYPNNEYRVGDALNTMIFPADSFTHITCLYFTIYYIKDKQIFFENCFQWLVPGGQLILHLVDKEMFDPIIPAGDPLSILSAQRYAKERITSTLVKFDNFQYKANFETLPNDLALFTETFKDDKSGNVRKNEHKLYMPTQKYVLSLAKDVGFILLSQIDLIKSGYEYQYLYVLQKPN